jgi:MFS family permease
MLVLPILHWTGHLSFGALLVASFAVGCFAAPYTTSSTLIAPEVAGYDENATARLSAIAAGGNQVTRIAGPVLAGLLIAAIGPANVLVVDAGTYVFSFLAIAAFVRVGARVGPSEESQGLLAGLRFLRRDSLLGPLAVVACALNLFVQALMAGLNALAFFTYDAHVAGLLFGGFGVGALAGALVAQKLTQGGDLLRLAAVSIVLMPLPLFVLGIALPWAVALVVVAAFAFFAPLVNAPVVAVLMVRTPASLRPKVMSAVLTCATLAAPLGFFGAGEALRWISVQALFVIDATTLTVSALALAAVLLRERAAAPSAPVVSA